MGKMVHIPHTHSNKEKIPGRNPTRRQYNPGIVICGISLNKSVWRNKEIQTPPRNRQGCHIGCICILLDAPLGQPDPKRIRRKYLILQRQLRGYKLLDPPHETPEVHPIQARVTHLQET